MTVGSVTLDKRPEKIVSLSPTATEMLFAIGAGTQVTAVDDQSNFPADAPKTDLSGFQPNAEAIAGKNPDLVVLSNDTEQGRRPADPLKIPVYLAPAAATLDDTYQQITDLGTLTGHAAEAADLSTRMKDDIDKLVKDVPQRAEQAHLLLRARTRRYYSVTSKTFIGSLFTMVGLDERRRRRRRRRQQGRLPAAVRRVADRQGQPGHDLPGRHEVLPAERRHGQGAAGLGRHHGGEDRPDRRARRRHRVPLGPARRRPASGTIVDAVAKVPA